MLFWGIEMSSPYKLLLYLMKSKDLLFELQTIISTYTLIISLFCALKYILDKNVCQEKMELFVLKISVMYY